MAQGSPLCARPQAPLCVLPHLLLHPEGFWSLDNVFCWRGSGYRLSCGVSKEPLEAGMGAGSSLQGSLWHGERVTRLGWARL